LKTRRFARALHATFEIDGRSPPSNYQAVPEVIGYVMNCAGPGCGRTKSPD